MECLAALAKITKPNSLRFFFFWGGGGGGGGGGGDGWVAIKPLTPEKCARVPVLCDLQKPRGKGVLKYKQ